jgi:hypothetical protein
MTDQDELNWTPLRLVVIAPLAGHNPERPRGLTRIVATQLDDAIQRIAPKLDLKLTVGGAAAPISLQFENRKDFDPKQLWAQAGNAIATAMKSTEGDANTRKAGLDALYHHPDFQKLESAWRGLEYLAKNGEAGEGRLVPLQLDALVTGIGEDWIERFKTQVFEPDYEGTSDVLAAAWLVDQEFDAGMASIERLHLLGEHAAAQQTPIIASVGPAMFGMKNLAHIPNMPDLVTKTVGGAWAGWNLLQKENAARWISLTVNRWLTRPSHESDFYTETVEAGHPEWHAWASAVYPMGVSLAKSFAEHGHCAGSDGLSGTGRHSNLPTRTTQTGPMTTVSAPTEIIISDEKAWELARAGFTPFIGQQNGDTAYFPFLGNVYRVTIGSITLDQALTYQLYAGQVSHTLLSLAGRMPATDPAEGCQWLEAQLFAELSPFVGDAPGTHVKATPVQLEDGRVGANVQITPTFKIQEKPLEFQVQLPLR